jgi:hypothetical protein
MEHMTYKNLLSHLQGLSEEQLNKNVQIWTENSSTGEWTCEQPVRFEITLSDDMPTWVERNTPVLVSYDYF